MQIANSKYHKVWEVKEENNIKKVTLGDSKKNKDGTYENWSWFDCMLVGKAKEINISKGDTVTIVSGLVQKRKYQGKYYDNIVIFELEVTNKEGGKMEDSYDDLENLSSDIPF